MLEDPHGWLPVLGVLRDPDVEGHCGSYRRGDETILSSEDSPGDFRLTGHWTNGHKNYLSISAGTLLIYIHYSEVKSSNS